MKRTARAWVLIALFFFFGHSQTHIPITMNGTLPPSVDNTTASWFPPIVDEDNTMGCGNATGIGYIFNFEANYSRNVSAKTVKNHFHWIYTYDILNGGSRDSGTYAMFIGAWKIAQENGIVSTADFTGNASGSLESILNITSMESNSLTYTKWPDGYDNYYRAMQCRVDQIDSFAIQDTNGLRRMKQWLTDHGNGSAGGGILVFTANIYSIQATTVPAGTPEAGKKFIKLWGSNLSSQHAMAIVGYNDSVRYDFNRDGSYTNNSDIGNDAGVIGTKDNKVGLADWEIGAYRAANTWGSGWMDGNAGLAWAPYRSLVVTPPNGGLTNNGRVYYVTIKKNYSPRMALKIALTHAARRNIALSVGVAPGQTATAPTKTRKFERLFTYAGGAYPMCGRGASPSIEIGLDVSDLLDSIAGSTAAVYFLIVNSKGGSGAVDSLSLMDYTSGTLRQTKSPHTGVAIAPGTAGSPATTYVGVATDLTATASGAGRLSTPRTMTIRFPKRGFPLQVPAPAGAVVSMVDMRGKRCFSAGCVGKSGLIDAPDDMPAGTYIITVTGRGGVRWSKRLLLK